MARPGRKPKPDEAHRRDGTRNRRAEAAGVKTPTLVAGRERPERPVFPDAEMRKVWDVVVADLEEGRVLDKADWSVIEVFVVEVVRLRQARRVLAKEGLFTEGQKGATVTHPARSIEERAGKNVASLADQLGLGPSGRSRLGVARGKADAGRKLDQDNARQGVPDSPRRLRAVDGGAS